MSTDPMFARGPDRDVQEDQDLRAPLTEYREVPESESERDAEDVEGAEGVRTDDDSNAGFEYGHEHVLHNDERAEEAAYATTPSAESAADEPVETAYGTTTNGVTTDATSATANGTTNGTANGVLNGTQNDVVIASEQNTDFRSRWREIQAEFIDDPQQAAEHADHLVAEITKVFAEQAEQERNRLSSAWQQKGANGTEELRLVMRRYRGLIDHMLDQ